MPDDRLDRPEPVPTALANDRLNAAWPARTLRDLLAREDDVALLLATMYEIGGMAVVA